MGKETETAKEPTMAEVMALLAKIAQASINIHEHREENRGQSPRKDDHFFGK